MKQRTTRRQFLSASALAVPMSGMAPLRHVSLQEQGTVGVASAPEWSFTVVSLEDPYTGRITRPAEPDPDARFVAVQVIINNASDSPLDFQVSDIRVRDTDDVEYQAGDAIGSEPRLVSQNLPDKERTRGWVWFQIPNEARVREVRFYAPRPVFRVQIPAAEGTPEAG
ncbi:MAG: hypothetical protein C4346_02720 [Chloroflexota bacterium]